MFKLLIGKVHGNSLCLTHSLPQRPLVPSVWLSLWLWLREVPQDRVLTHTSFVHPFLTGVSAESLTCGQYSSEHVHAGVPFMGPSVALGMSPQVGYPGRVVASIGFSEVLPVPEIGWLMGMPTYVLPEVTS